MTRRLFVLGLLALTVMEIGSRQVQAEAIKQIALRIEGMTGPFSGPPRVKRALEELPGVKKAEVSFQKAQAVVEYDPSQVSVEAMIQALQRAGFRGSLP